MKRTLAWFENRLNLRDTVAPMLLHPIPRGAAGPMGWWYVFGSASMTLLMIQILTGIGLALVYVPSTSEAYASLVYLNEQQPLGWFLRSLHYWSGSGMVIMVAVHMTQVFLHGAFKYPRELNWVSGVVLLLLTLGMAFTGQVMRWDADAYWGVGVGASMAGRVPAIGPYLVDLLLGGPIIGSDTLSRFFALHVFVIPGLLLAMLALHLWLVLKRGISAPPVPGQTVDPRTYQESYEKDLHEHGVPFFGEAMLKDALFSALVTIGVILLAAIVGPKGPGALPEPALVGANPKPDWPFLWLFALLSLSPPSAETVIILGMPVVLLGALLLVPFISNRGERAPSRRPVAVLSVIVMVTVLAVLTYYGATEPWSPVMGAWSGDPVPEGLVKASTPLQLQGAVVLQNKQCRNCHALEGVGGRRGPDLSGVGSRLTRDQLIDQVSNGTPGGGNMPAYGKQIRPAEMTALVDFLVSLRPPGHASAPTGRGGATITVPSFEMDTTFDAFLRSWPFDPWILISLLLSAFVYLRGWLVLQHRDPARWPARKLVAFLSGLGMLFLALASPIETFTSLLLQVHMLQHLLLMMAAPPLLWLGAPLFPMLLGLPRSMRTHWVSPVFRSRVLRRMFQSLTHPVTAWLLFAAATWFWHLPATYDLALGSDSWHYVQHVWFLGTGLLFWYPVIRPYPSRPRWSPWLLVPYLILADVQNTLLAAWLTFSGTPLYSYYADRPRIGKLSVLEDQAAAGVLMWVPGSLVYLIPLFVIGVRLLFGSVGRPYRRLKPVQERMKGRSQSAVFPSLPIIGQARPRIEKGAFDLLRVPILRRFLGWRHARVCLQLPLFLLALCVVFDGFFGPPIAAMNLAGVLPWIHWRGLLVLGLLASGNVFCMACPFMLPRGLARQFWSANRNWPPWLKNKWPAVVLLIVFLWAYEAFALWDSPRLTAAIIVGYFATALVIDALFRGASFCKYVCPIGQFNFVHSLVSPMEVRSRDPDMCASCRTKDCIRGRDDIKGCELGLFVPRKSSNMDCTFCLDCIHSCPHQNIGISAVVPGAELWKEGRRSGVGRFSRRIDLAALCIVLVAGAFANAALMTEPLLDLQDRFISVSGIRSPIAATSALCLLALVLLPWAIVGGAAVLSRRWGRSTETATALATRFAYALVPLGFGMWLAHYGFHFLASYEGVVPVVQRFFADRGVTFLGSPDWTCTACIPAPGWLLRVEIIFLDFGLLLSLYAGYRIAHSLRGHLPRPLRAFTPWAILIGLLFALGIWIVFQPMQMRGTMRMTR